MGWRVEVACQQTLLLVLVMITREMADDIIDRLPVNASWRDITYELICSARLEKAVMEDLA